ncbi:DUF2911 domain-containing protein [Lewinella sp. 4G2]|uniref:DUF2911 domain-containing protein n=1 Tax=Lewinella sp. 4G2 TaxID=1803372 RepID=UPI0007B4C408|nr:DUF2911 domain-containing protein [Lewinella sp. 4G2]OAV43618.1 hypothetical protein A3850_003510 [Lewinella sp. 4G2]
MRLHYFFTLGLCLLFSAGLSAQDVKFGGLDKSPMDGAYYPSRSRYLNYLDEDDKDRTMKIRVLYSRPKMQGRELFGELIPYGQDWRLGANEATEITFFQDVEINNVRVFRGTYTMFAEPVNATSWIWKLSKERFIGGSQDRDVSKDIVSAKIDVIQVPNARESFTIGFQDVDDNTIHMFMEWGNSRAKLPININPAFMADDDPSPMDLVQYPNMSRLRNFVKPEELAANEPKVRVVYSRPQLKDRVAFGELIKYGELWRLGANETPQVFFFEDVMIDGKPVKAGRYGLFARPEADEWEFVLHKSYQSWGTPNFDEESTVLTFKAKTEKTPEKLEALSATFVEMGDNTIHLIFGWEDTMARLPITLK